MLVRKVGSTAAASSPPGHRKRSHVHAALTPATCCVPCSTAAECGTATTLTIIRNDQSLRDSTWYTFLPMKDSPENIGFDKTKFQVFSSFEEAEAADKEYYRSLSPAQRIEIMLMLREQYSA